MIQRREGDFTKLVQHLTNIILSNGKNYQLWPGHWKHNDFPKQSLRSRILEEKLGKSRNIGQFLPKSRKSRNVQKKEKVGKVGLQESLINYDKKSSHLENIR